MALPTLLLVPGAWLRPAHLRPLARALPDMDVRTVALASCGDTPAALGDMHEDAEIIARAVAAIDGPVVVLAHSYGGIPATQALAQASNVQRVVYLAAFLLDVGETLLSSLGGAPNSWIKFHQEEGAGGYIEALTPEDIFFDDVEDKTLLKEAVSQVGYQAAASINQPVTEAAWKTVPSTYLICEEDKAIPASQQEVFAQRAGRVRRLRSSHCPFLSQPAALARLLKQEAST
jgi:pimeloyl-ACP methyl ester carboxylesterase